MPENGRRPGPVFLVPIFSALQVAALVSIWGWCVALGRMYLLIWQVPRQVELVLFVMMVVCGPRRAGCLKL